MKIKTCSDCGWPATLNMHPGEVMQSVPDHDNCPVCGARLLVRVIDESVLVSRKPPPKRGPVKPEEEGK